MAKRERPGRRSQAHYALKGLIRCAACERRMQADRYNRKADDALRPRFVRYRCRARDLVEGSPAAREHPADVSIQQELLLTRLSGWLGSLLGPNNRESTVAALVAGLDVANLTELRTERDRQRLAEVEKRLAGLLGLAETGVDPEALAPRVRALSDEAEALRAAVAAAPLPSNTMTTEAVEALVSEFADAAEEVIGPEADPEHLLAFFRAVGLEIAYDHVARVAHAPIRLTPVTSQPHTAAETVGGANVRVRGGT